ncbi:MAG: CoA transferase [Gammaproteobacteria bacterium]|jgi:formyl-CoA transferase|nr:CoA transferase [Gammaproteobacteria bacterium]
MDKQAFYAAARTDVRGPLHGIKVVEATTTWAGPMAACLLADFGATVVKVEHPAGEVCRKLPPMLPDSALSMAHETVNRNKRNVSLDLRKPQGREMFLALCRDADIVVENFKPGTLAGWGVGYADVAAVKPDIIYVSVSGYGQFGPLSDRPAYDPIAQNFTGWTSLNGDPAGGPTKAPTFLGDDLAGMHGALGALAALQHRNRTGEGQHVDVALIDGLLYQSNGNLTAGALGMPLTRYGNQFALAAPVNVYRCSDGSIYGGVLLDSHWRALCGLLERPDLASLVNAERIARRDELDGLVAAWCAAHSVAEVTALWTEAGITVTRVQSYAEASGHPHVAARDMLQPTTLADGRTVPLTGPAAKFSRTPTRVHEPAATLGQHNAEIYGELGYDAAALARLKDEGVI